MPSSWFGSAVASLVLSGAILGAGCWGSPHHQAQEKPAASSSPAESVALPVVSASAAGPSASAAPPADLHLALEASPQDTKNATLFLDSVALGLHLSIGPIGSLDTCRLSPAPPGWEVSCTPRPRIPLATVSREGEQLRSRIPKKESVTSVALPHEAPLAVDERSVSVRELPDFACPPGARAPEASVSITINDDSIQWPNTQSVFLTISGDSQPVALATLPMNSGCKSAGDKEAARWNCPRSVPSCQVRVDGDAVVFSCDGPAPVEGRRLLRCGAKGLINPGAHVASTYN